MKKRNHSMSKKKKKILIRNVRTIESSISDTKECDIFNARLLTKTMACASACGEINENTGEQCHAGSKLQKKPICLIVLGMAGSGKTTFVQVSYPFLNSVLCQL